MAYCSTIVKLAKIPAFPWLPSVTHNMFVIRHTVVNISYMLMVCSVVVGWLIISHTYVCEVGLLYVRQCKEVINCQ